MFIFLQIIHTGLSVFYIYLWLLFFQWGFPKGSAGKEFTCNVEALGLIPGLGRSAGEEKGYPLQYSGLDISMDYIVHGVAKSWTRLSDFHFHRTDYCFTFIVQMRHLKFREHISQTKR